MKTPIIKNNQNLSGFLCCHKLLAYCLIPIKLGICSVFFAINLIIVFLYNKGIISYDICYTIFKLNMDIIITCFGLTVKIIKDKEYEAYKKLSKDKSNKYLIAFTHRNFCDLFALLTILQEKITAIGFKELLGKFPISYLSNFFNLCLIERNKPSGTVKKILEHYEQNTNKICIAPDGSYTNMNEEEKKQEMEKLNIPYEPKVGYFKSGAFVNKTPILPIVLSSVGSTIYDTDWNDSKNTNSLTSLKKLLIDGNVELHMKFLELQKFDEEKHKNYQGYRDDVREKMVKEHSKLAKPTASNLENIQQNSEDCINFVVAAFGSATIISYLLKRWDMCAHSSILVLSGLLYHGFPTNTTAMFDRIAVFASCFFLLLNVKNTFKATLLKTSLLSFSLFQWIKNNFLIWEDFYPKTQPNIVKLRKTWLYHHVYSIQLPGVLAVFVALIDNELFVKN